MPKIFLQMQMNDLIHMFTLSSDRIQRQTHGAGGLQKDPLSVSNSADPCMGLEAFRRTLCKRLCLHFNHSAHFPVHIIILSELKFASIPEQPQMNSPEQTQISKIKIPRKMENVKARTRSHFSSFQGRDTNSEVPICCSDGSLR